MTNAPEWPRLMADGELSMLGESSKSVGVVFTRYLPGGVVFTQGFAWPDDQDYAEMQTIAQARFDAAYEAVKANSAP